MIDGANIYRWTLEATTFLDIWSIDQDNKEKEARDSAILFPNKVIFNPVHTEQLNIWHLLVANGIGVM